MILKSPPQQDREESEVGSSPRAILHGAAPPQILRPDKIWAQDDIYRIHVGLTLGAEKMHSRSRD